MLYVQVCDAKYGPQGLALWRSLEQHSAASEMLWICLDADLLSAVDRLKSPHLTTVDLETLFRFCPDLRACRNDRGPSEWLWTLASQASYYALETSRRTVTYVDSDLFFFSDPAVLYREMYDADTAMIDHRFPVLADGVRNMRYERGVYNVGFNVFRYQSQARECCRWWADRVRMLCVADMPGFQDEYIAPHRAGDQAWLEAFDRHCRVHVINHPGAGLAPYNFGGVHVLDGKPPIVRTDATGELPVIFVHFHEFRCDARGAVVRRTNYPLSEEIVRILYGPYEDAVRRAASDLRA